MADTQETNTQGAGEGDLSAGEGLNGAPSAPADTGKGPKPEEKSEADKAKEAEAKAAEEAAKKAKENEKTEEEEKEWDGNYITLPDPAGQSVINLLKESGVGAREASLIFGDAMASGELSKIKWDVLEEKLGKDKANLARAGVQDYYNRVYSKNTATTTMAHEAAGGEENWNKVAAWVKKAEKADPKLKADFDEIRAGIDAGGRMAKHAVKDLIDMYHADTKNQGLGNTKINTGTRQQTDAGGAPLSRNDYMKLMKEAQTKKNNAQEIASLRARRDAGRAKGL